MGLNANLPACIAVKWAKQVTEQFHARFSATARRYRYLIYNHMLRPAILAEGVTHIHAALDAKAMHEAGQSLVGEQDFSSFRAAMCQSHSPWRNINHLQVARNGDYVVLEIEANAFVHHMVRNIAGSLIEVGNCNQPMSWIKALLVAKDRTLAAATAKPNGLYLISVSYPEEFGIPQSTSGPLFLPATL
jgi:tRNA pseudouridine38-40 synthase